MTTGDWAADRRRYGRQAWLLQPSFWAVTVYRYGRWTIAAPRPIRMVSHGIYFALYSIVRLGTGIDIPRTAAIGPGLMIHHFGTLIIHPQATIGSNCTLRHGVTIGERYERADVPVLGDNVSVGAYGQVLGAIHIGDDAKIGAMSLVMTDVPAGASAVGNPARILTKISAD